MHQPTTLDLSNCDREPIHELGQIQQFGALLTVNADWIIAQRSANLEEILGREGDVAIGTPLSQLVSNKTLQRLQSSISALRHRDQVERLFGLDFLGDGELFDCALHSSGPYSIIEVERHAPGDANRQISLLRPIMSRLEEKDSVDGLVEEAARQLRAALSMDRVMVYRFHDDLSGEVMAESKRDDLEAFHGLRYPKSDIPAQARELYLRNRFRIISDINEEPVPIEPSITPEGTPLDLSMSTLRAVSRIHVEYLQNMGVEASLSISIVIGGKLWGLFACHHYSPKVLPYSQRTAMELFSEMFSLVLERAIADEHQRQREKGREVHDRLMRDILAGTPLAKSLSTIQPIIHPIIEHDGISVFVENLYDSLGAAPNEEEFRAVVGSLNSAATSRILSTDALTERFPLAEQFADRAVGALVIPVSRSPRDYLVLWRKELNQTVTWAGNPEKPAEVGPNGIRLTPRKSFEAWQQSVEGRCSPWTDSQLELAENLRITLLEIILRLTDEAMQERSKAQAQQELLIAELNHRVRNILNLIRGLITQSRGDAATIEDFADIVGGRISALASAHDNITKGNWSPARFSELIETEVRAYLANSNSRLELTGPDVLITPEAYTVMALVMHEMITNSAKYGSLSNASGRLAITIERGAESDDLRIRWRETGGPPVKPPTRRGFGSTIIERSIPFELGGEAAIDFRLAGLAANFSVPARYVTWPNKSDRNNGGNAMPPQGETCSPSGAVPQSVLLVEDSMIIALDTEDCLRELGVERVTTESNVAGALAALKSFTPDVAILDYNLGAENSEQVALKLSELGVPFWLATGYGEMAEQLSEIGAQGLLTKPYGKEELNKLLHTLQTPEKLECDQKVSPAE